MAKRTDKNDEKEETQQDQSGPARTGQQPEKRGQAGSTSGKKSGSTKR